MIRRIAKLKFMKSNEEMALPSPFFALYFGPDPPITAIIKQSFHPF
jgi:hypothetical protein